MPQRSPSPGIRLLLLVLATLAAASASCAASPVLPSPTQSPGITASAAAADQLVRGEAIYRTNCQGCHGDARTGKGVLPGAPVHGPAGHTWHHSDRNLTEIILDGPGQMGEMMREMMGTPPETPHMPAWRDKLSDEDIEAILAYIKAGWTPKQRRFQTETPMMR